MALVMEGRVQEGIRELDPLQSYSEVGRFRKCNLDLKIIYARKFKIKCYVNSLIEFQLLL